MPRIIIDTNVLVSALIQRSYPYLIGDQLFADPSLQLCISDELFAEYFEVLQREKFSKYPDFIAKAQAILADIDTSAIKFQPTIRLNIIGDTDDNKLLELAETSGADFLITGNTQDFTMAGYKGTKILSP